MASHCAKPLSFLFLVLLSASLRVEARESKLFSKVTHNNIAATTNNVDVESEAHRSVPAPAPEPVPPVSSNGYGLYGHDSSEFPPAKKTTTTTGGDDEKEIQTEELGESYSEAAEAEYPYNNNNNNNGYSNNNNNYYSNYNDDKNGAYVSEKEGMSDTRFLEKGKYYYNADKENYYGGNGYESERGIGNGEGYYYKSKSSDPNEFDSMEEYERQQGYPEIQGEYVP